jgi:restriction system protein
MARKNRNESILDVVAGLPWWIGVGLAVAVYIGAHFILPAMWADRPVLKGISMSLQPIAWMFSMPFLLAAGISFIKSLSRRKLADTQTGIHSIRELHWLDFERLVGEVFRRQGYHVEEQGGAGPDGGIDLVLHKGGRKSVVQCKRWRSVHVGVSPVRELYGVMTAERADACIFVSSGTYTADARAFADGKPIQLIEGEKLASLLREVQFMPLQPVASPQAKPRNSVPVSAEPSCPKCGKRMIQRTAKTGPNAGNQFWGCSQFPQCRGVVQAAMPAAGGLAVPRG